MVILLYLVILILVVIASVLYQKFNFAQKEINRLSSYTQVLNDMIHYREDEHKRLEEKLKKVEGQKKSSEVRTGLIAEQMAPFLEGFPADPRTCVFLGRPLDFVSFSDEAVRFIEVKSGNAQLNSHQRQVRDLIESGKVTFEVYRIKGE